jgi:hypothetical protein
VKCRVAGAFFFVTCLLAARDCRADFMVSLSSTTPGLSNLSVGQTVSFDVNVSGLKAGDTMDFIGVTVNFDGALFKMGAVQQGTIIPDARGFSSGVSPAFVSAFVTGQYDDLNLAPPPTFYPPITTNGTLFSFSLKTQQAGQGIVAFASTSPSFIANDSTGHPLRGAAGPGLSFDIQPSSAVVPEPASLTLLLSGAALGSLGLFLRKWRAMKS